MPRAGSGHRVADGEFFREQIGSFFAFFAARSLAGGRAWAAADGRAVTGEGMSLTLPYVPARLVIEVSGPAGSPGLLAGADDSDAAPGRLALVRARTEATGR